ncbi:MAG: DUF4296 domain-containing protein [Bacteroidota bacterium]
MLTAACNSILKSKPAGTLSENQMISLLVDLHITEATLHIVNDSVIRSNNIPELRIRFAEVFRKHGIKPDDFDTSLNYYIKHVEELDKIYAEVINRLSVMDATLQQKAGIQAINATGKRSDLGKRNPWFPSTDKTTTPREIQYFDSLRYPVPSANQYNLPNRVK